MKREGFWDRRHFPTSASILGAGLLKADRMRGRELPTAASDKKVAAIVTAYHCNSHTDNIVTRFMDGYNIVGKSYAPPYRVASLFIDQVPETDVGRLLAGQWEVPVFKSTGGGPTLGGDELAVDGVLLVTEQGDYPLNHKGQKVCPRRRFFKGKTQPVNGRHLEFSLAPGAGAPIELGLRCYAHQPTLAWPW